MSYWFIHYFNRLTHRVSSNLYLCMDFKIIWHNWSPEYIEVQFGIFIQRSWSTSLDVCFLDNHIVIVRKRRKSFNQHLLIFPTMFLPYQREISTFESHFICHLQMLSICPGPKFCWLVKGYVLTLSQTSSFGFLAPLAKGQRAIVMALCPSCVRPFVRACVRKLFL